MHIVVTEVEEARVVLGALVHNGVSGVVCIKHLIEAIVDDQGLLVRHLSARVVAQLGGFRLVAASLQWIETPQLDHA